MDSDLKSFVDQVYREQSRQVFATLVRLLGDFDLAEEAMHEAFAAAVVQWPGEGIPDNPRAWLVSAGRFKAIDAIRRRVRHDRIMEELAERTQTLHSDALETPDVGDDRLRLIFTCCHPALSKEAQLALTLREVCDLKTEDIASAFLTTPTTLAQRIVRAKAKIRDAKIPYEVPQREQLPQRLDAVLHVIYLVFHAGYAPASGTALTRPDLSQEAIRLGKLLLELLPEPEVMGLLALMLLHESRREARSDSQGHIVLLEEQDRTLWKADLIAAGQHLVARALSRGAAGPYVLQAAIAAVHASARTAQDTDWNQIARLYDALLSIDGSPIIQLNRAVAIAMRDGADKGLELIDDLLGRGELAEYHLAYSARAELCRRLGKWADARQAYEKACEFVKLEPEREFLHRRLAEVNQRLAGPQTARSQRADPLSP